MPRTRLSGSFDMNADHATCLATASVVDINRCRRPDPVPSRVAYHHPLTNYERMQAELAQEHVAQQAAPAPRRRFSLPPAPETHESLSAGFDHGNSVTHRTHPADLVYWVACLGGACLLLLCATR
jgi:hypothetical protein